MESDAVVIGGGAAGLAASRLLARRGTRVVLLEARDRVGGRVFSVPTGRVATPAELGAEFIHGRAVETIALLRETGTAAIDIAGDSWTRNDRGVLENDGEDFSAAARIFEASRSRRDDESVDRFLRRFEANAESGATARAARAFVEGFEAADPAIASAQAIAYEWGTGADTTSGRPLGGYARILDRLRDESLRAGAELRLATVVRSLSWRKGSVTVDAVDGAGLAHEFRAKAVIVTLPVGVLKHRGDSSEVVFEPELPSRKHEALRKLEMGHVVKLALWFRNAFWEELSDGLYRHAAFFHADGLPIETFWTQVPVHSELIVGWAGGPKASALAGLAQDELVERAVDSFGALFDAPAIAREQLDAAFTHDWSADRYSRGAYSYVLVGGAMARAALAAPVDGTLFFAGEATSTDGQGGTVNGALESGERAAAEAAAVLA